MGADTHPRIQHPVADGGQRLGSSPSLTSPFSSVLPEGTLRMSFVPLRDAFYCYFPMLTRALLQDTAGALSIFAAGATPGPLTLQRLWEPATPARRRSALPKNQTNLGEQGSQY